jgi:hypothetical protein
MKGRSRFANDFSIAFTSVTFILNSTEDGRYPDVSSGINPYPANVEYRVNS